MVSTPNAMAAMIPFRPGVNSQGGRRLRYCHIPPVKKAKGTRKEGTTTRKSKTRAVRGSLRFHFPLALLPGREKLRNGGLGEKVGENNRELTKGPRQKNGDTYKLVRPRDGGGGAGEKSPIVAR